MGDVVPFRRSAPDASTTIRDRVLVELERARVDGLTWKELAGLLGVAHGSASAALSELHKVGRIVRLSIRRGGCKVYVDPRWVQGRSAEQPGSTVNRWLMEDMAELLRRVPARCKHTHWHPSCRSCDIRLVLNRYDNR